MANKLIGKTVVDMKISEDKDALLFITELGEDLVAYTDGDCCSTSWVESIELPALGFPFTVLSVEDLDLNKEAVESDWEYIQFYGAKVSTTKGDMVIDYRNSSNGWYGGSLEWPGSEFNNYTSCQFSWMSIEDAG